jgi:hypothetical protein
MVIFHSFIFTISIISIPISIPKRVHLNAKVVQGMNSRADRRCTRLNKRSNMMTAAFLKFAGVATFAGPTVLSPAEFARLSLPNPFLKLLIDRNEYLSCEIREIRKQGWSYRVKVELVHAGFNVFLAGTFAGCATAKEQPLCKRI